MMSYCTSPLGSERIKEQTMKKRWTQREPKESKGLFALGQFHLYFLYFILAWWSNCVALWTPELYFILDPHQSAYARWVEGVSFHHSSPFQELQCVTLSCCWSSTLCSSLCDFTPTIPFNLMRCIILSLSHRWENARLSELKSHC